MDIYDVMTTTATTRAFKPDPVDDAVLYRVLDKARFAPQGGNRQGHRVVIVRDPAMRRTLRDLYKKPWDEYTAHRLPDPSTVAPKYRRLRELIDNRFVARMDEIPVHLLVAVNLAALEITDEELDRPSVVGGGSVYPFVQNILLACRNEGLGAALTTLVISREPELAPLIRLPEGYALAAHILIGWPDPDYVVTKLRRRPVERFASLETFDGTPLQA